MNSAPPKLISFVGRSNSGKTTFITQIIPKFTALGLRVGSIKNTHHVVDFDKPGKDSWKHAQSGSSRVVVTSAGSLAVYEKTETRPSAVDLSIQWFQGFDLVISEGFKNDNCLKIEVFREANKKTPLYTDPAYNIQAVISDNAQTGSIPHFHFADLEQIVDWIRQQLAI